MNDALCCRHWLYYYRNLIAALTGSLRGRDVPRNIVILFFVIQRRCAR